MKIWTCGNSTVPLVWANLDFFFGAILMISCRNWWPWTKPGYITMTRRQSNNQWSGGIPGHPAPKKFRMQKSTGNFLASIFWDRDGILHIDFLPKGQTINAEYYSFLLVQLKDVLKEKRRGKFIKRVLFLHDNVPAHPALATRKKTGLPGLPVSWSPTLFSGSGPIGLPPVPWTDKTIERSPFFFRRRGQCCRGDLVGRTNFLIFFEWLTKVRTTG